MAMSAQLLEGLGPLKLPLLPLLLLTACLCSSGSWRSCGALARSHPDSSAEIMIRPFMSLTKAKDMKVSKGRSEGGEERLEEGRGGDSTALKGSLAGKAANSDLVADGEGKGGEDGLESMPAGRGENGDHDTKNAKTWGPTHVSVIPSASFTLQGEWQRDPHPESDERSESSDLEEERESFFLSGSRKWRRRTGRRLLGKKKVRRRRKPRRKNKAVNEEKAKGATLQGEDGEGGGGESNARRMKKGKQRVKDSRSSRGEEVGGDDEGRVSEVEGGDRPREREVNEGRRGVEQRKVAEEDRGNGVRELVAAKDDGKTGKGKRKIRRKGEEEKEDGKWNAKTKKQRRSKEEGGKSDGVRGERGGVGRGKRKGREGTRKKGSSVEDTASGDLREDGVGDVGSGDSGRKGRGEEDQGGDQGRGGMVGAQAAREGGGLSDQGRNNRNKEDEGRARELAESKAWKDGKREGSQGQLTATQEEGAEEEGKGTEDNAGEERKGTADNEDEEGKGTADNADEEGKGLANNADEEGKGMADNADQEGKGMADNADQEGKGMADSQSNVVEDKAAGEITQEEGQREEEQTEKALREEGLKEEGVREEVPQGVLESDGRQSSDNGVGEEIAREVGEPSAREPMPAALQASQQNQQGSEPEEQEQQQHDHSVREVMKTEADGLPVSNLSSFPLLPEGRGERGAQKSGVDLTGNPGSQETVGTRGMDMADREGPEMGMGRGKPEEEGLPLLSAEEQLEIEQQAHEDDERYVSFMSEAMGIRHRLSPTLYAFKEKTKKLVLPKIVSLAKSTRAALVHTSKTLTHRLHPYVGSSYSPALATILSYTLLILPFVLLALLFNQVRVIFSLRRVVLLCNLYLMLYCAGLLVSSIIISAEPMASLRAAAETNFYVLQIVQAAGYVGYLVLQAMHASAVWRKRKERDQDVRFPLLKAVVQVTMATGVGLHYYVTVFERAMLDQTPQTGAAAYLLYCMTFAVLTLLARADGKRNDKQR